MDQAEGGDGVGAGHHGPDFFYLSLMLIGGAELVFHSVLPGWVTYGGIPAVLLYIAVFVMVRRRRRSLAKPSG